jgi:hypothetical protein
MPRSVYPHTATLWRYRDRRDPILLAVNLWRVCLQQRPGRKYFQATNPAMPAFGIWCLSGGREVPRPVWRMSRARVIWRFRVISAHGRLAIARSGLPTHTQVMARCRARTKDGTGPLCRRRVEEDGLRCYQHRGLPTAPPRLPKPSSSGKYSAARKTSTRDRDRQQRSADRAAKAAAKRRERVEIAADYCSDVISGGWSDAVADRAAGYVTQATWTRLFRTRRNHCKALAELAEQILAGKDQLYAWVGGLVSWILSMLGAGNAARDFVGELTASIPIPLIDVKVIAVARGVQVTGILLCVVRDDDLTRCQCFIDLALVETKTQVEKILVAAVEDWTILAKFPPKEVLRSG